MKGARIANRLILVKHDGILELVRPKPGEASYANAEEYSRIDFRAILGQWQSSLKSGHSLLINFADGATIELSNFFDSDIPINSWCKSMMRHTLHRNFFSSNSRSSKRLRLSGRLQR